MSVPREGDLFRAAPAPVAYEPAAYGDALAESYDSLYPVDEATTRATVGLLADLAGRLPGRSLLEMGVGTGRLAVELRRQGIAVAGIDASQRMIDVMRSKPLGWSVRVAVGDYRDTVIDDTFSVVALVFNNVLDPRGTPAQLDIFRNAARHLEPGGYFVVEAFVLPESAQTSSWTVIPRYVGEHHVEFQMSRFDVDTRVLERRLVHLGPTGTQFVTVKDGYAAPAELDIMAHVAGLERHHRYADWSKAPFTATSAGHVTVYRKT